MITDIIYHIAYRAIICHYVNIIYFNLPLTSMHHRTVRHISSNQFHIIVTLTERMYCPCTGRIDEKVADGWRNDQLYIQRKLVWMFFGIPAAFYRPILQIIWENPTFWNPVWRNSNLDLKTLRNESIQVTTSWASWRCKMSSAVSSLKKHQQHRHVHHFARNNITSNF